MTRDMGVYDLGPRQDFLTAPPRNLVYVVYCGWPPWLLVHR